MKDLNDYVTGNTLTAADFVEIPSELQSLIIGAGISLSSGDLAQAAKAIANYSADGDYYADSGSANTYVLSALSGKSAVTVLRDGQQFRFRTDNASTSGSTVNVNGLGVKAIVTEAAAALTTQVSANDENTITYDLANTRFVLKTVPTALVGLTGSTVFTQSTNNIGLTGIGLIGLSIGDVIAVTSTDDNDKDFTVEVLTDDDNIIVNQAHAGGTTTKSLVDETISATITLVARAEVAAIGLGQGMVIMTGSRASGVSQTNNTKRSISYYVRSGSGDTFAFLMDGITVPTLANSSGNSSLPSIVIPPGSEYTGTYSAGFAVFEIR